MVSSYAFLLSLVLSAALFLSEVQSSVVKKTAAKKKKAKSKQFDEFAPDSEAGTECFDSCYPTASSFDADGKLKNPKQYGEFIEICGKTYLFGTISLTWEENWKTCCSIGMMPLIFNNRSNFDCVWDAATDGVIPAYKENDFWAGGFQHGINNLWHWCTKDTPEPMAADFYEDFLRSAPKTKENVDKFNIPDKPSYEDYNCVYTTNKHQDFELANFPCNAVTNNLACESVQKYPQDLQSDVKCKSKCETLTCTVNKSLIKPNTKQEQRLKERYKNGKWIARTGRYFMFSKKNATYDEARKRCCSYGASLVSLKSAAKRVSLFAMTQEYPDIIGDYWTSGSDVDCDGNYRWCSVDRAFLKSQVQWAKNQPKSADGDCVWVKMSKNMKETSLSTADCSKRKKFICEVQQMGSSSIKEVKNKCIGLLGLTIKEVSDLENMNKYTYKMKCYLRCLADNLGMIDADGDLQEGNALRLIEKSINSDDLFEGRSAIYKCRQGQDSYDGCESTYEMYKCAKKKAPVVFRRLTVAKEVSSEKTPGVKNNLVPRTCELSDSTPASQNSMLIHSLKSSGKTPEGGRYITAWNDQTWFKSHYSASHNYKDAFNYCTSLELRLPSADNLEDFKAMYDFMNGSTSDNFYAETESTNDGFEKWCNYDGDHVPSEISADKFRLLSEPSILVSKKGTPKYTLTPVLKSQLATSVTVNHFFCQPIFKIPNPPDRYYG